MPLLAPLDPFAAAQRALAAGHPHQALRLSRQAPAAMAATWLLRGLAYEALAAWPAAVAAYRQGLACRQAPASLHNNLGDLYRRLGCLQAARRHLEVAVQRLPTAQVLSNYGLLLKAEGRFDLALAYLELARNLAPQEPRIRWNLALLQLQRGALAAGWAGYEAGLAGGVRRPRPHPARRWNGGPVARLWVAAEQGLGDEILFATCLPEAAARAKRLYWEADARLLPLLRAAHPEVCFLPRPARPRSATAWCPQGSLPALFRRRMADFPRRPVLTVPEALVRAWRARLRAIAPGPWWGLAWAGGSGLERGRRSLPLAAALQLLRNRGVRFVDLQYGQAPERGPLCAAGLQRFADLDVRDDLVQTAALMRALDGVVAVSSATAHLGGAVGARVHLLLPCDCGWRWFGGARSPWYPAVWLHRQPRPGHWRGPLEAVQAVLRGS